MKIDDIREMDSAAISEEILDCEKALMELRMGNAIGTTENPLEIRYKKRDVARLKTVLCERKKNNK
jgi:large subunit ribosomal protein L29